MKKLLGVFVVILSLFLLAPIILLIPPQNVSAQLPQQGKLVIYGTPPVGDGLIPGWTNGSLFNGVNTWNLIDTEMVYEGQHALSWTASAPFERGWLVSPNPVDVSQYQYLNFYARAKQEGQRYEVGFTDAAGTMVGTWVMIDSGGGPIRPDRWQNYSFAMTTFALPAPSVGGIGFRDANGAPQPKVFFDNIELAGEANTPAVDKPGAGQNNNQPSLMPSGPPKPKMPYYPNISPWVFIIPGIIVFLAIFFE